MDHETRGQAIDGHNRTYEQSSEDHFDAMEVDSAPSMMIDTDPPHDQAAGSNRAPVEATDSQSVFPPNRDLGLVPPPDAPRNSLPGSREPPAFDEDTERPRQRRRYHVTMEEDTDTEFRPTTDNAPAVADGTSADDEVAVLETARPRLSDLSIHTPRSTTPPPAEASEHAPMSGMVSGSTPPNADQPPQSPHLESVPLPDVPLPPPNGSSDPVMEAARRLTSAPDVNADQMQADLALLAPYIAAQAMAAAFPLPVGRPPGSAPNPGDAPNPDDTANPGNPSPDGQDGTNNGLPPLPFFFGLPPFMFGGGNTEAPADPKRAERLANGLKVVEEGLLKRWKAACGDEGAVCAVCYSELLEEPGIEKEKDAAKEQDEVVESQTDDNEQGTNDEDAHERALRDALKRRELMEKIEKQEKELKLETAVLAFPCGHVFHRTCLLPWLSRHTTCPTCRFDIDPKSDTLTLPADDGLPPFLGPGGFNFGDFFTVGPVLRVPRAHAPNLGPRVAPRPDQTQGNDQEHDHEHDGPNRPGSDDTGSRPPIGEQADNPGASRLMSDLFDSLLRPFLQPAGAPPPQRPASAATGGPTQGTAIQGTDGQDSASQGAAQATAASQGTASPGTAAQEAAARTTTAQETRPRERPEANRPSPAVTRTNPPAAPQGRPDYDRPLAMFGRPSPRRQPQPITPAWMRHPQPVTTTSPATATSAPSSSTASTSTSAPSNSATPTSVPEAPPAATSSPASAEPAPSNSTPPTTTPAPQSPPQAGGFGQLRAIVSNLIPRRLSTTVHAPNAPSTRSNGSSESNQPSSASQSSRPNPGPISPRAGIRAILQGPTALLRDLAAHRPSVDIEDRGGNSAEAAPPTVPLRPSGSDDMPDLESDSEDGLTHSEDDAHSSADDDMPALELIEGRTPRAARRSIPTARTTGAPGNDQASRSDTPVFGPPRPPASDNMMDNIITLRIDLGHADGRDETIIVPLLFNPNGRGNDQNRPDEPRPTPSQASSRPRTPQPIKKWVPPEPIRTFRQAVEEKEREAGWRCDDPACLLGPADDEEPSDEHPVKPTYSIMHPIDPKEPARYKIEDGIRVYADGEDVRVKGENPVCAHVWHPECLVTSARVNGWGPDHNAQSTSRVTLRCPVCRLDGTIDRQVWDAGVQAEEAGDA